MSVRCSIIPAGFQEQALLSCLWITGARPSEILELRKENILITEDIVVFDLPTKKLQADGTRFVLKRRQLRIGRPTACR